MAVLSVSVGVAAAVAVLVGGGVTVGGTVPVEVAVPLVLMLMLTFPRLQATTVRMMAEIPIRNHFVRLVFILSSLLIKYYDMYYHYNQCPGWMAHDPLRDPAKNAGQASTLLGPCKVRPDKNRQDRQDRQALKVFWTEACIGL
jgi:hypothetical protein